MTLVSKARVEAVIDSSVLINFLKIDRCDLLGAHPRCTFALPAEVWAEIRADYAPQLQCLSIAVAAGHVLNTTVDAVAEVELAARLHAERLGWGECAAIAAAICRSVPIAIQDKGARKKARKHCHGLSILTTEDIIVDLIGVGVLDVPSADAIKASWETMKFKLSKFKSFAELLPKGS